MNIRIVICEKCGGDGGWEIPISHDPFKDQITYRQQVCADCDGEGEYEIEPEPVYEEDFEDAFGP